MTNIDTGAIEETSDVTFDEIISTETIKGTTPVDTYSADIRKSHEQVWFVHYVLYLSIYKEPSQMNFRALPRQFQFAAI